MHVEVLEGVVCWANAPIPVAGHLSQGPLQPRPGTAEGVGETSLLVHMAPLIKQEALGEHCLTGKGNSVLELVDVLRHTRQVRSKIIESTIL